LQLTRDAFSFAFQLRDPGIFFLGNRETVGKRGDLGVEARFTFPDLRDPVDAAGGAG
jgi:hypothetical protein